MNFDGFNQHVEAMRIRLGQVFQETGSEPCQQHPLDAMEELQTMFEELEVASEELNQQSNELEVVNVALKAERERYLELFEFAPEGYFVTDPRGKILEANGAAANLLNVQQPYLLGKPFVTYIAVEDRKQFRLKLDEIAKTCTRATELIKNWEIRLQPRERDILFVSLNVAGSSNKLTPSGCSLLWSIRDISERVKAQADLKIANRELDDRVVERTVQLSKANDRLRSYTQEIERKNQDMQDFTFIASHDLQEPLRKIKMFGDLLKNKYRDQLAGEGADYIDRMTGAANRMQDMVNGLLGYSRVSTTSAPFVSMDLNRLAAEVLLDLDYQLDKLDGQVQVGELPVIEADPMQIRALFANLIGNSLKFHRPDVPSQVKIWAEKGPENVKIYFQDNGAGMDLEHFQKIFHPFQRFHSRQEFEGTGMGLAICRKIVERHSGEINVTSNAGSGTTFIVTLPVSQRM